MFRKSMCVSKYIPMTFTFSGNFSRPFSLIINNRPLAFTNQFKKLINDCSFYVCADGGANRLLDAIVADGENLSKLPDCIVGDMDSLRADASTYFKDRKVSIIHNPDQDSNDIEKAFEVSLEILKNKNLNPQNLIDRSANKQDESLSSDETIRSICPFEIIVWRFLGSRIDHLMSSYKVQHFSISSFE